MKRKHLDLNKQSCKVRPQPKHKKSFGPGCGKLSVVYNVKINLVNAGSETDLGS